MLLIGIVIFTISISSINAEEVLSEVEFNKLMENHVFNLNTNTAEEIIEQKRIAEIEELSRLRQRSGGSRSISIPYESQINNYYCGPASVRMVVRAKGGTASQATIGAAMQTDRYGSSDSYMVINGLSRYVANRYSVVQNSVQGILSGAIGSIDKGFPVVANVRGRTLDPRLENVEGHFVVVSGYEWGFFAEYGYSNLTYVDPWLGRIGYNTSPRTVTSDLMHAAIDVNYGLYVRSY